MFDWIKQHRWKTFFVISLSAILLALPVFLQSTVQKAIHHYTQPYGIQAVTLEDIDLNLFTGQLEINQLALYQQELPKTLAEYSVEPITTIGLLTLNISLLELIDSKIHIEELGFKDAELPFELNDEKQLFLAGIPLSQRQQKEQNDSSEIALEPGLGKLRFENIQIELKSQDKTNKFHIHELTLEEFYSWSEESAHLEVKSSINHHPLSASLQLHLFKKHPKVIGTIRASEINIDDYLHLIPKQDAAFGGTVSTDITFTLEQSKNGLQLFQQGNIDFFKPHLNLEKTQVKLEKVSWKGDFHFTENTAKNLLLNGELNLQQANVSQKPYQASFKQAALKGKANIILDDIISIQLSESLSITGLKLKDQLNQQQVKTNLSSAFKSKISINGKNIQLDHKGNVTLKNLSSKLPTLTADVVKLHWQGSVKANQAKTLQLSTSGSLALNKLRSQYQDLQANIDSLDWQGKLKAQHNKSFNFDTSGQVELNKLALLNHKTKLNIAKTENLTLTELKLQNTETIQANGLRINHLEVSQSGKLPGLVKLNQLNLDKAHFKQFKTQQTLSLGKLVINGSETNITLSKDNQVTQVNTLLASLPIEPSTEKQNKATAKIAATDKAKKPFQYQLSKLEITGNNPVYLTYNKVNPAFTKTLSLDEFILQKLDSRQPHQASPFTVQVTLDEFSKLSSKGEITPLDPTHTLQASTQLESLSLLDLSPLSENAVGYHIKSGQLSAEIETKLNNNQIDSQNKLHLNKLELQSMDSEKSKKLQENFPVPLETGLAMLQDKNDNINLSLPVKGDISSPDFNVGDVVSIALGKALAGATRTYLLLALQPFGAIAMVGEMALDQASAISLQAIEFNPGSKTVTPKMQTYLQKIHALLSERKAVQIKLCDGANEADRVVLAKQANQAAAKQQKADLETALKNAKTEAQRRTALDAFQNQQENTSKISDTHLIQLAEERQKTIKRQLIKLGVASNQLIICKPKVSKDNQKALVNLNI